MKTNESITQEQGASGVPNKEFATPLNDARQSSPAKTKLERAEQALMWLIWHLSREVGEDGEFAGLFDACIDMYPEIDMDELRKKEYPISWPESYDLKAAEAHGKCSTCGAHNAF
jgi:hypothetical protein